MKFAVFICLLGFVLVSGDTEEECQQRAEGCIEIVLVSVLPAETPEESCKGLDAAIECLDDVADDCVENQQLKDEVEEGLKELRKVYTDQCEKGALVSGDTEEDCKQRAEGCIKIALDSLLSAKTPEGFCKGLDTAIECLDDVVDDCVEVQPVKYEVEGELKELRKAYSDRCEKGVLLSGDTEEECQQRVEGCLKMVLASVVSAETPEESCKGLDAAIDCLDDVMDDCVEDQPVKDEVEEGLKELRKVYTDQCEKGVVVSGDTDEECQQRAEGCIEIILVSVSSAETPEESCIGLDTAIECLDDVVDDCVEDQSEKDEIEEGFKELRKVYTDQCEKGVLVSGDTEDECQQRAEGCIEIVLVSVSSAETPEESCKGLDAAIECLDDVVDDCVKDQSEKGKAEEGLKELRKAYTDQCEKDHEESDQEAEKCIQENAEALYDCVKEGTNEAVEMVLELKTDNEDVLKCLLYGRTVECSVGKIRENCGEEIAVLAEKEFQDKAPSDIREACEATASFSLGHYNILLRDKKKRK